MITKQQYESVVERSVRMLERAGIVITPEERTRLEVADFGLGELEKTGLEILTYVNTERACAKELIMFPHQTCPEHWHPTVGSKLGKEETFRCRWGTVYLYVPGSEAAPLSAIPAVAYFNVCAVEYNMGKMSEAAAACDKAITVDPNKADAYFIKGSALYGNGTIDKNGTYTVPPGTIEALNKYLKLAPTGGHAADVQAMLDALKPVAKPKAK